MPVLPSGRRIEFSLDRFHALLGQIELDRALVVAEALQEPDDLLFVMDAVHFDLLDGSPYFANYVAADWELQASDWSAEDRDALRVWFGSDSARFHRTEAITSLKTLMLEIATERMPLAEAA